MSITTRAVLLRRTAYRDADWIVSLFGRDCGRVSALARGARKSRKRFGGALQPYVVIECELAGHENRELDVLRSAELIRTFPRLAADASVMAQAGYATELVRELTASGMVESDVFDLLVSAYQCLDEHGGDTLLIHAFGLQLLSLLGNSPPFDSCVHCGTAIGVAEAAELRMSMGGFVGTCCLGKVSADNGLAEEHLQTHMAFLQSHALKDSVTHVVSPEAGQAIRQVTHRFIQNHLGKSLRSLEFAKQVARG